MKYLVFPLHDPDNVLGQWIKKDLPLLKEKFNGAFVSITPKTLELNPGVIEWMEKDDFFVLNYNAEESSLGDHHRAVWKNAMENTNKEDLLHLCSIDRVVFALENFENEFLNDISDKDVTMYLRSKKAWSTHPKIYEATEGMVTKCGEVLFNKTIDYIWCYVVVKSKELKKILPMIESHSLMVYAEVAHLLRDKWKTKEVDWLAWEDPFIFKKEIDTTNQREKRMSYVIPIVNYLLDKYQESQS